MVFFYSPLIAAPMAPPMAPMIASIMMAMISANMPTPTPVNPATAPPMIKYNSGDNTCYHSDECSVDGSVGVATTHSVTNIYGGYEVSYYAPSGQNHVNDQSQY